MSVWQYAAVVVGWSKQHETDEMSEKEADDIWNWLKDQDVGMPSLRRH